MIFLSMVIEVVVFLLKSMTQVVKRSRIDFIKIRKNLKMRVAKRDVWRVGIGFETMNDNDNSSSPP